MKHCRWPEIPLETLSPLIARQVIHTETMTLARLYLKKGAVVPEHSHPNEQISTVVEGRLLFEIAGQTLVAVAGDSVVIPPDALHRVTAEEDAQAVDVFAPPREDWIRGDDAYLRR
jgi:quercetin dioxygenase-like cupin family protein